VEGQLNKIAHFNYSAPNTAKLGFGPRFRLRLRTTNPQLIPHLLFPLHNGYASCCGITSLALTRRFDARCHMVVKSQTCLVLNTILGIMLDSLCGHCYYCASAKSRTKLDSTRSEMPHIFPLMDHFFCPLKWSLVDFSQYKNLENSTLAAHNQLSTDVLPTNQLERRTSRALHHPTRLFPCTYTIPYPITLTHLQNTLDP
jgi:hypothetical protein